MTTPPTVIMTDIKIDIIDPHPKKIFGDRINLAHSGCRPDQLVSDIHETLLEAAELLQEHAPFREGAINACYECFSPRRSNRVVQTARLWKTSIMERNLKSVSRRLRDI